MKIKKFKDLTCWQKAMELCLHVYKVTNKGPLSKDYDLSRQIRRAAISIPSNIAEGFERGTTSENIHFLYIAKGSAGELRIHLQLSLALEYISQGDYQTVLQKTLECSKLIFRFIEYLKKSNIKGDKHVTLG